MKIAVVNNCVPFIYGGAEFLADSLTDKLREYGHQAILVRIPFSWQPPERILDHMLACRLLEMPGFDRVIALKFPAYYVNHDNKVLWLLHQFRQAYDMWGTAYHDLPQGPRGVAIRDSIIQADNRYLSKARMIYTNSRVTKDRLMHFNGIPSEVLHPPLMESERYSCREYSDFIFYPSRISGAKRQFLAIEAMRHVKSGVKLVVAGNPDTPQELKVLEEIISKYDLKDRVELLSGWMPQDRKIELFSRCLGCVYIPYDEDSYGYVTLEAYHSRKPVITCRDSGGTLEVVKNGETGYVTDPTPEALAAAMDRFFEDRRRARELGEQGYRHILGMNITWDHVIGNLTA